MSFFRKRWDQSTRRLWCIFAFVRSCALPQRPKGGDETRRSTEYRPAKPPTAVVCASRLPPPLMSIPGGDNLAVSPTPISSQPPQPTILSDTVSETHENHATYSRPTSRHSCRGSVHRTASQYSLRPPSQYSRSSSPELPVRPPFPTISSRRRVTPGSARQSVHTMPPELPQAAPSEGRLRPMTGINRYEKHKAVVIEAAESSYVSHPVTTQFVR